MVHHCHSPCRLLRVSRLEIRGNGPQSKIDNLTKRLGGQFVDFFDPNVTHVVARVDSRRIALRTIKVKFCSHLLPSLVLHSFLSILFLIDFAFVLCDGVQYALGILNACWIVGSDCTSNIYLFVPPPPSLLPSVSSSVSLQ